MSGWSGWESDELTEQEKEDDDERIRIQRLTIMNKYERMYPYLYSVGRNLFCFSFVNAVFENSNESFRNIVSEPFPGIFTFDMLTLLTCRNLMEEVEEVKKFANEYPLVLRDPNLGSLKQFGQDLDNGVPLNDIGMKGMLNELVRDFISPMSKVLFPEYGVLDSNFTFVMEFENQHGYRSVDSHWDNCEVTLHICLGKRFSGGEFFFEGVRCKNHRTSGSFEEETFKLKLDPGMALLHRGGHRNGVKPIMTGTRTNLTMWCRSSAYRELIKDQQQFSWCKFCEVEKKKQEKQKEPAGPSSKKRKTAHPSS